MKMQIDLNSDDLERAFRLVARAHEGSQEVYEELEGRLEGEGYYSRSQDILVERPGRDSSSWAYRDMVRIYTSINPGEEHRLLDRYIFGLAISFKGHPLASLVRYDYREVLTRRIDPSHHEKFLNPLAYDPFKKLGHEDFIFYKDGDYVHSVPKRQVDPGDYLGLSNVIFKQVDLASLEEGDRAGKILNEFNILGII